jgi:hypothetical protein
MSDSLIEAGKRMSDIVNSLLTFNQPWELRTKWLAIKLENGGWDGNVYDSMADAKRFSDPDRCCYFSYINCLGGCTPRECERFLHFHRKAREAGHNQADPGNPHTLFPSVAQNDAMKIQQRLRDLRGEIEYHRN